MSFDSGPAFGAEQAKEVLALLGRAPGYLPRRPICRQPNEKSCPVALCERICDCPSHVLPIVPRFRSSGFQVGRIAGELGNAFDLFFCVADWSNRSTGLAQRALPIR